MLHAAVSFARVGVRILTPQHYPPEDGVIAVEGAAVPAVMAELVLALVDPLFGAFAN